MYKRVLTIQDISCLGQCSLTVALPIISASGNETVILPSAILSTHTMGFKNFTCLDLESEMPKIINHWKDEKISFDAVYTGYLGTCKEVDYVLDVFDSLLKDKGLKIVDPAMADFGKLYPAFNQEYVEAMKRLCSKADIILPNITEAAYLTSIEYKDKYDENYIHKLVEELTKLGSKIVVLTGVSYKEGMTGVLVYDGNYNYYSHKRIGKDYHGTGDVYSSAFVGHLMNGFSVFESAKKAADFVVECIEETMNDKDHIYGVKFEKCLNLLNK